jgi:hypothetical protein
VEAPGAGVDSGYIILKSANQESKLMEAIQQYQIFTKEKNERRRKGICQERISPKDYRVGKLSSNSKI